MWAIGWVGALCTSLKGLGTGRAAEKSARRWRRYVPLAAEVDALESRLSLSSSISSFLLASDTGIPDDNVTAEPYLAGVVSFEGWGEVYVEFDFDRDGLGDAFTMPNADGSFHFDATGYVPYGEVTVWARTQTWNSDENAEGSSDIIYSEWVELTFTLNRIPAITSFTAVAGPDNEWTFEGTVSDESVLALTVVFGGVLEGHQVLVNGDGTFSYCITLSPDQEGVVTAQTTDEYGEESEVAEDWVFASH